jgi:hypothetical protein
MSSDKFGEGIFPLKKFPIDETPNGTSLSQTASFEYRASKSTGAFRRRVVTGSEKKKKLANTTPTASPCWADEHLRASVVKIGL